MFGFIMVMVAFFLFLAKSASETKQNDYLSRFTGDEYTYRDIKGVTRYKGNGKAVFDRVDPKTGHRYLLDKHHNVVLDATEDEMLRTTAEKPGDLVKYDKVNIAGYYVKRCAKLVDGERKFYSFIHYKDADFLVDLQALKIVCPTSSQLRFEMMCKKKGYLNYTEEGFKEVIDEFNNKDEIDRGGLIGECDGTLLSTMKAGSFWSDFLYSDRKPRQHSWSYFAIKAGVDQRDRPWIH